MDRLRFRSLASGSSGNCYFIGTSSYGILIDAGVGIRAIKQFLKTLGLDFHHIWAIFVTHDHTDHVRAVGVLGEKHHIPIYATEKIHAGIERNYRVTARLSQSKRVFTIGEQIVIGEFRVNAFPVSHDASECVGYTIDYKDVRFSVCTDLGEVSEEAADALCTSDYFVLEANYDEEMLWRGRYPQYLKERIDSTKGHLDNLQTAEFLSENITPKWQKIFLCHLSNENNTPERAVETIRNVFAKKETVADQLEIIPLERTKPSAMYVLAPKEKI